MPPASIIAYIVLLGWIPLGLLLGTRLSIEKAAAILLIGGTLFLPQGLTFNPPILPILGKQAFIALAIWAAYGTSPRAVRPSAFPQSFWIVAAVLFVVGAVMTTVTNTDRQFYGPTIKRGLALEDAVNMGFGNLMYVLLPMYLGQRLFGTCQGLRYLLKAFVIGAVVYLPLVLLEARLAPFLHRMVYGYFQHDWAQARREGGFRAFVFMSHGLAVALLMSHGLILALGLWRLKAKVLPVFRGIAPALALGLVACKSMASIIYAGVAVPLVLWMSPRALARASRWIAWFVLIFPILRLLDVIPLERVVAFFAFDPERAQSLEFRFNHEVALLEKARERIWFGWGGYGRNRIFDAGSGLSESVIDGQWILELGGSGVWKYVLLFGLLLLPVFRARRAMSLLPAYSDDARTLALATFLLALQGLDLLPNGLWHSIALAIAGATLGAVSEVRSGLLGQVPHRG